MIDLGLSKRFAIKQCDSCGIHEHEICGSAPYMAPEVIQGDYDQLCDNWSLGILMYILLCGQPPFRGVTEKEIFANILKGDLRFPKHLWQEISSEAKDLITQLLQSNPRLRIKTKDALNHKWFKMNHEEDEYKSVREDILYKLQHFSYDTHFRKEIYNILVENVKEKDMAQLRKQFNLIDFEHNGYINYKEEKKILKSLGKNLSIQEYKNMCDNIASDFEEGIHFTDFIAATFDKNVYLTKERLRTIFNYFDIFNKGYLTSQSLKIFFARKGRKLPDEEITQMIDQVDYNGDHHINFQSFLKIITRQGLQQDKI